MNFESDISDLQPFSDSDLIVAADGVASVLRDQRREAFGTDVRLMSNFFCWLGSTRELEAFKYFFRMSESGPMVMHTYQYEPGMSTWICEMPAATMRNAGFLDQPEEQYVATLAELYAEELDGHDLITNRSVWRRFPRVRNASWVDGNIVLIGDAQHTAHFSIGSGTKLAMESSIALFETFRETQVVHDALELFETTRREQVEEKIAFFDVIDFFHFFFFDHPGTKSLKKLIKSKFCPADGKFGFLAAKNL